MFIKELKLSITTDGEYIGTSTNDISMSHRDLEKAIELWYVSKYGIPAHRTYIEIANIDCFGK